ncbi:MAG: DUF2442 domain-containing protein [Alloprevotella sp.]|nr:DUF2442 domain-containing protein [Alloprevotella sp.]
MLETLYQTFSAQIVKNIRQKGEIICLTIKKGRHKILIVPGQSLFWGFNFPRFSPFREHKTRPGLKDLDFFKRFSVKYNTVEWENGADFAPEYLLELPEA